MEVRNIITFVRVAELLSFSKAANRLGYSQAAVTVQVKQLEQELGVRLFDRMGKAIKLTSAGEKFLPYALEFLRSNEALQNFMKGLDDVDGTIRIATSSSVSSGILPQILLGFTSRYPDVRIQMKTTDIAENMFEKLFQNETDFIFNLSRSASYRDCIKVAEREESVAFVASADHPLAKRQNVPLSEVLQEKLVLSDRDTSYCLYLSQYLEERGVQLDPVMEISSTAAIAQILETSNVISFLPRFLVEDLLIGGRLSVIDTETPDIKVSVQMIRHRNKWVSPQMQAFMDYVVEVLR